MYWTRLSPFVLSFVKTSLCRGWLTCVDVQTRWCYMDVETRNICFCDHDHKDVVQMLRRMYSCRFSAVSRQQSPIHEWLCRAKMWHVLLGPCAPPRGTDSHRHDDPTLCVTLMAWEQCFNYNKINDNRPFLGNKWIHPSCHFCSSLYYIKVFLVHFSSEATNHWLFKLNDKKINY